MGGRDQIEIHLVATQSQHPRFKLRLKPGGIRVPEILTIEWAKRSRRTKERIQLENEKNCKRLLSLSKVLLGEKFS